MADAHERTPHEPTGEPGAKPAVAPGAAPIPGFGPDPVTGTPLDDLLWELDVTTVRQVEPRDPLAPAPAAVTPEDYRPSVQDAAAEARAKPTTFHRPELRTPFERFTGNLAVRIVFGLALVGGTAGIVALAVTR